jgi:hypothetical protein
VKNGRISDSSSLRASTRQAAATGGRGNLFFSVEVEKKKSRILAGIEDLQLQKIKNR